MSSIDPLDTFPEEIAGIVFQVRELKASGVRDIGRALKGVAECTNPVDMLDILTPCALRHVASWNKPETLIAESLEDALNVREIISLLNTAVRGSRLTVDQKKESE